MFDRFQDTQHEDDPILVDGFKYKPKTENGKVIAEVVCNLWRQGITHLEADRISAGLSQHVVEKPMNYDHTHIEFIIDTDLKDL